MSDSSSPELVVNVSNETMPIPKPVRPQVMPTELIENMDYRELQRVARHQGIPRNLKKNVLKSLIEAKANKDDEQVNFYLKQVKQERLERKRLREKSRELFYNNKIVSQVFDAHTYAQKSDQQQKKLELNEVVKSTLSPNVTICQTKLQAHYKAFLQPTPLLGYPTGSNSTNTKPLLLPPQPEPVSSFSFYATNTSKSAFPRIWPHYPEKDSELLVPFQSKIMNRMELDPPPIGYRNNQHQNQSLYNETERPSTSFNMNDMLSLRETASSFPGPSSTESQEGGLVMDTDSSIQPQSKLPGFMMLKRNVSSPVINGNHSSELQLPNGSTNLECLANIAAMTHRGFKDEGNTTYNRPLIGGTPSDSKNQGNEVVVSNMKTAPDVPTWKTYLEQLTDFTANKGYVTCKYGCSTIFHTVDHQLEHESNCLMKTFPCPKPFCTWMNQLSGLDTHILNTHHLEVISFFEARFVLDFTSETFATQMNVHDLNPRRLCFFQFVNHRIFVISAIANFQTMQMFIYIQYVNDGNEFISTAALELFRSDGLPHQWSGRVLPINSNPVHLIARRHCMIFQMSINDYAANSYILYTKIRNHL